MNTIDREKLPCGYAEFKETKHGSFFMFDGKFFIKTREVEYLEYEEGEHGHYNAISIKNGKFYNFGGNEVVALCDIK